MNKKVILVLIIIGLGMVSGCIEEIPEEGNEDPIADFIFSVDGLTVSFSDNSSDPDGTIESYSWNFGDGNESVRENPTWEYTEGEKTYTVTLTVTDNNGSSASVSKPVTIGTPTFAPTAAFSFAVDTLTVSFTDESTDQDGTIVSWSWDFGDQNSSTDQNPTHEYSTEDIYQVTLTVTDNDGKNDSETKSVNVGAGNAAPEADFTYEVTDKTVSFTDASSDADGDDLTYTWAFGDGETSTDQNPEHTYDEDGVYTVNLIVSDGTDTDTKTEEITVGEVPNQPPTADFAFLTNGLTAFFIGSTSTDPDGDSLTYEWDFGDGSTPSYRTEQSPIHTYEEYKTYEVTLTVTDDDGATDSITKDVEVTPPQT